MKRISLLIYILCIAFGAWPQTYMFKRIDAKDGLPNNQVNAFCKDSEGYLWMGTTSGLARYDGYDIRTFRRVPGDTLSLPDNYIDYLAEDGEGRLWLHTGKGFTWYDRRTEHFQPHLDSWMEQRGVKGALQMVAVDEEGNLWMGVYGMGCYRLKRGEERMQRMQHEDERVPTSNVTALVPCSEGMLVGYANGRVECIDREKGGICWALDRIERETAGRDEQKMQVLVDSREVAWIYSYNGVWAYDLRGKRWLDLEGLTGAGTGRKNMVRAVAEDDEGRIWMGMDQEGIGVLDRRTGKWKQLLHDSTNGRSLPHNTIACLYRDNEGTLWVGTDRKGVAYYNECIYKCELLPAGDINCMVEDAQGGLWMGSNDNGLLHYRADTGQVLPVGERNCRSSEAVHAIVCLLQGRDGRLWTGTFMGGLQCREGGSVRCYRSRQGEKEGLASNDVWALAEDSAGNIWIGTLGAGIQCLNPHTGKFVSWRGREAGLPSDYISSFTALPGNRLLVATTEGLAVMDMTAREMVPMPAPEGERLQNIHQAMVDSRGWVWVAMRDGLLCWDSRTGRRVELALPAEGDERFMAGLAEDGWGNVWVTTSGSVLCFSVQRLQDGYSCGCRRYDAKDGLQGGGFNQRSIRCLKDGRVVMGGVQGVNVFHPREMKYNHALPKVHFTAFQLFNEEVRVGAQQGGRVLLPQAVGSVPQVVLEYGENIFSVLLASDNLILPDKTTYRYRLEGFSNDWMTSTADLHRATYTNLAPGTYRLQAKAVNSDGVEGTEVASLKIVIRPPFWRTTGAYMLYGLLAMCAVAAAWYGVHRRERNRFRIRQLEEDARKKEELNQMKFRFFTNVSHELRTPLTLIISPIESLIAAEREPRQKERLARIHRNALRLLHLVNQLLDFRKLEMAGMTLSLSEGDMVAFVRSACASFLGLSEKKQLQLTFHTQVESLEMTFDEDKMGKVLMNLLSNAFKFTPEGGRVEVSVQLCPQDSHRMLICVADTGIGISDADKAHVFDRFFQVQRAGGEAPSTGSGIGLSLVHDFVALHQGDIRVLDNAEAGQGSVFRIELPVRQLMHEREQCPPEAQEVHPENGDGEEEEAPASKRPGCKPLALVVDDNEDLVEFMRDTLDFYFRVETAANGCIAWQMIQQRKPDIVVSDVMMPEMDGNELCRRLKSDLQTRHIPLMLLTAKQTVEDKVEGLTLGADDYVTKPFNVEVLVLRMRKLIALSRGSKQKSNGLIEPEPAEIKVTPLDEKLVAKAIRYVEENMERSELSVEELSQALGMSRVHLYKKLMQITGKKPIEFIRIIRLKRAAQLLRESQQNVSEIAYQVGFNNPKYFSRYFKEEFGVLPSAYQEEYGKRS